MIIRLNYDFKKITRLFFVFTITVTFFFLFLPYFRWLGTYWLNDPANTFGYLAPFVSVWAIYSKRNVITSELKSSFSGGWFVLVAAVFLLILYYWNSQAPIACVAMSLFLYGVSLILMGKERSRYLTFPVFFLIFLYPWGDLMDVIIGYDMRRMSVILSYYFYKFIGMDADISGTYLYTGRFLINIAPACSGLTIMNVLIFMGAIGVYLCQGSIRNKILIFVSIFPLAIVSNTIRIIITGLIGHYTGEDIAIGFYDNISGILVFGVSMLILYSEILFINTLNKRHKRAR